MKAIFTDLQLIHISLDENVTIYSEQTILVSKRAYSF